MKKLIAAELAAAALLPLCACAHAEVELRPDDPDDPQTEAVLEYALNDEGDAYIVTSAIGGDIARVPSSYNGLPVEGIDSFAFSNGTVRSVEIAEGVKYIGQYAFNNCYELTKAVLPESLTSIGSYAFCQCSALQEINLPDGLTEIPTRCFFGTSLGSVVLPSSVKHVGDYAFSSCRMESLELNEVLVSIGEDAFSVNDMTRLRIPSTVTELGESAFEDCRMLRSVNLPGSIDTIPAYAFAGCQSLVDIDMGDGTEIIDSRAFYGCNTLVEITIPATVGYLGRYAFKECSNLNEVVFEEPTGWFYGGLHIIAVDVDMSDSELMAEILSGREQEYGVPHLSEEDMYRDGYGPYDN